MCALEKEVTSHSSILAWIEEPGGLQLLGSHSETPPKCLRTDGVGLSTEDSALMQPYSGSLHSHLFFFNEAHLSLLMCGVPAVITSRCRERRRRQTQKVFSEFVYRSVFFDLHV